MISKFGKRYKPTNLISSVNHRQDKQKKKFIPRHILIKLLRIKDQEKCHEKIQKKNIHFFREEQQLK